MGRFNRSAQFAPQPSRIMTKEEFEASLALPDTGTQTVEAPLDIPAPSTVTPKPTGEPLDISGALLEGAKDFGMGVINVIATPEAVLSQFALGLLGHQPQERFQALSRIIAQKPEGDDLIFFKDVLETGLGITDEKLDAIVRPVIGDGFFQTMDAVELFSLVVAGLSGAKATQWARGLFKSQEPIKILKEGVEKAVRKKIPPKIIGSKQNKKKVDKVIKKAGARVAKESEISGKKLEKEISDIAVEAGKKNDQAITARVKATPVTKPKREILEVASDEGRDAISRREFGLSASELNPKQIEKLDELVVKGLSDKPSIGIKKKLAQAGEPLAKTEKVLKAKPKKVDKVEVLTEADKINKANKSGKFAVKEKKPSKIREKATAKKAEKTKVIAKEPDLTLPEGLQRSAPRFRQQELAFESDVDKALYIVANRKSLSSSDSEFGEFLSTAFPDESPLSILGRAKAVKKRVAAAAKSGGDIVVVKKASLAGKIKAKLSNEAGFLSISRGKKKVSKPRDAEAAKFDKAMDKNAAAGVLKEKKNAKGLFETFTRQVVDTSGNFKKRLDNAGQFGRKAKIDHDLTLGSNSKSALEFNEASNAIYGTPWLEGTVEKAFGKEVGFRRFTVLQQRRYDKYAIAKRNLEIVSNKRNKASKLNLEIDKLKIQLRATKDPAARKAINAQLKVRRAGFKGAKKQFKFEEGVTELGSRKFIEEIEGLHNPIDKQILASHKEQRLVYRGLLSQLRKEGLLTEEMERAIAASGKDYTPRQIVDWVDPLVAGKGGSGRLGKTLSVRDSGIVRLSDEGTFKLIEQDTQTLMNYVIQSTNKRIARNRANKALLKLAEETPDNGLVELVKTGTKPVAQKHDVFVMVKGKPKQLRLNSTDFVEWVERDTAVSMQTANWMRRWSGSNILRFLATSGNPEFAVSNLARDMAHIWLVTDEFSKFAPKAALQMGSDMVSVFTDAVRRKGTYIDYIKEGGGMSFLTHQGRITEKTIGLLSDFQKVVSFLGETSEIMTRLALRRRALNNIQKASGRLDADQLLLAQREATWTARNFIDFSQGGSAIKAADNAIPYLNASIQGTRGLFRAASKNPGVFIAKSAQIATLSAGLYLANRFVNPKTLAQVSEQDRKNNFIIPLGDWWEFKDKEGNPRNWVMKIPKDQGQRFFSTLAENFMIKMMGDDVEPVSLVESLGEALPNVSGLLPPTVKASLGYYLNIDFWTKESVWRGPKLDDQSAEITDYTHPAYAKASALVKEGTRGIINLSPSRLQDAVSQVFAQGNIYTDMVGLGWKKTMGTMKEADRTLVQGEMHKRYPLIRKVFSLTDPFNADRKKQERDQSKAVTRIVKLNREFDVSVGRLIDEGDKKGLRSMAKALSKSRDKDEAKRLLRRLKTHVQLKGTKDDPVQEKRFWLGLANMNPEARAINFVNKLRRASKEDKARLLKDLRRVPAVASKKFLQEVQLILKEEKKLEKGG